jgi:transposase
MPQLQLPMFPVGVTPITSLLAFIKEDGNIIYFNGSLPVFSHAEEDTQSFRMITAQFCVNGHTQQAEIARAFGVTSISVKRSVKLYREEGARGFYKQKNRRGATILTPEVIEQVQQLLSEHEEVADIASKLNIKADTLSKAIRAGRLHKPVKKKDPDNLVTSKSERSSADRAALMGVGAQDVMGRVAASIGDLESVAPEFQPVLDVPNGGVLFALPALLAMGLLKYTEQFFKLPKGYYGLDSLFLLLAFMALTRLKSIESLRYCAPGEWGKLLGLDRIPEARTLRVKVQKLSEECQAKNWSAEMCSYWMESAPEQAGVLYIDGHVRVYNGQQTQLPKHHVARQKLCLRATTDYWVNAMDGQPFMVVNKAVDPGMIKVIENDILPELAARVPAQAERTAAATKPYPHKFTLVFDREGYSPEFMARMKARQVAVLTYHKYPGDDWSETEFSEYTLTLPTGETTQVKLAERGVCLSNKLWVREIRKLTERGHQTSILATDYQADLTLIGARMFARWCQENYFKYMREHYGLDKLADYSVETITEPTQVVNPVYRDLDGKVRSQVGKLNRMLANFGAMHFEGTLDDEKISSFIQQKADLNEAIEQQKNAVEMLKKTRKETPHHIDVKDLPEDQKFKQLSTQSKHLVDTIKMTAYRAETAMANSLRGNMSHPDEVRTLLCALYKTEADLLPDLEKQTLTIRLHHLANVMSDNVIEKLCTELNATETRFPRTNLRMVFKVGSI